MIVRYIRSAIIFLLLLSLVKLPKHYAQYTGGFRLSSCHTKLDNRPEWAPSAPPKEVEKIFSQPFFLSQRGSQSYAFMSQDGQYMLKIFAKPLKQCLFAHKVWPYRPPLDQAIYHLQMEKGIEGYHLAGKLSSQYTALLYLHLNTTQEMLPSITLQDSFKRTYTLPLDSYRFVLQKKCELLAPVLKKMTKHQPEEIKPLLDSYLQAIAYRASLGIRNRDTEFRKNFGLLDKKVIEFDCGEYFYDPALLSTEEQQKEICLFKNQIEYWINKYKID
ncbi:MAG: hypothetical protein Q8L98_06445 [Chlamydiales bacterium]|nr:hypothetical protein [Chlamydiales bacterium]